MLSKIKEMISEQVEFLEAASTIYEDAVSSSLDDSIILNEDSSIENDDENDYSDDTMPEETKDLNSDNDNNDNNDNGDTNLPLPGDDDLPTPVGAQTGEPITDDINNILDSSIDLASNTLRDTLPIPPSNAIDAINSGDDDILNQRVDSGFGGNDEDTNNPTNNDDDEDDDILNESINSSKNKQILKNAIKDEIKNGEVHEMKIEDLEKLDEPAFEIQDDNKRKPIEPTKIMIMDESSIDDILDEPIEEAVKLGDDSGDSSTNNSNSEPSASLVDDNVSDNDSGNNDEKPADSDNAVTAAVKDKVDEMDDNTSSTDSSDSGFSQTKEELLKKLGNITKNIEDTKKAIMDAIH